MELSGDHGRLIKWHQPDNFAFVERSRTMKAPVGLLSDRTVLRSKMEGLCPDKFRFIEPRRVYHTIPQSASKTKRTTDRSRWFLSSGGGWSIRNFTSQAPASFRSALVGACLLQTLPGTSTANWKLLITVSEQRLVLRRPFHLFLRNRKSDTSDGQLHYRVHMIANSIPLLHKA